MSMYLLPKTILKRLDKTRKRFFWQGGKLKKKYHLVKWEKICLPKEKGGLGVHDLKRMNYSLLCKWWWKLENEEGTWQEIVKKKYVKQQPIGQLKYNPGNSHIWNDLLKVKDLYLKGRSMLVKEGKETDFWNDQWCGAVSLKDKFPQLMEICNDQVITVSNLAARNWNLSFRRWLDAPLQNQLRRPQDILFSFPLSEGKDPPKWLWEKNGRFSVKSMYESLCSNEIGNSYRSLWKSKIPPESKKSLCG